MRRILFILKYIIITSIFCSVSFWFFQSQGWVKEQIRAQLAAQGLSNIDFEFGGISFSSITLKNVRMGDEGVFTLKNLRLGYTIPDLIKGKIAKITLSDLAITVQQNQGKWYVSGFSSTEGEAPSFKVLETPEGILAIPVDRLIIENSMLALEGEGWSLDLPVSLVWDKSSKSLSLDAKNIHLVMKKLKVGGSKLHADLAFKDGHWQGAWNIDGISTDGYPEMSANGKVSILEGIFHLQGKIQAQDKSVHSSFSFELPFSDPKTMHVSMQDVDILWGEGHVRVKNANIPIDGKSSLRAIVEIEKIGLQQLLSFMTGQEIVATGTISGKIPMIVAPDGTLKLENSHLSSNGVGVISVPAEVIPGAGEQIDLTRQILDNFSYDGLAVNVVDAEKGRIAIVLNLSGNNPKVYDGRAVKLNVRLGGDVLEFLQSNIMMLTQPESMLRQESK